MPNYYQHNGTSYVHVSDYAAIEARLAEAIAEGNHWKDAYAEDVSKLDARLAEAERDAARYRWLRDCSNGEVDWPNSEWDAAIDAEIAADRETAHDE